jgi:hypothetical protein
MRSMRPPGANWLSLTLLWPLLARAADINIPELGVRMTGLPDGVAAPEVIGRAGGHEATTRAGEAQLSVYREDGPVPADGDVAEPAYRAQLDARLHSAVDSRTLGAPTSLGGHSAWTVVDARQQAGHTVYDCISYVIVDRHLYRFAVTASAAQGSRPAEFDALVRALSQVSFGPVRGAATAPTAAPPPGPRGPAPG